MRKVELQRELDGVIMVPSHELEQLILDAYADEIEKEIQTTISDVIGEEVRDTGSTRSQIKTFCVVTIASLSLGPPL